jgi:hypothetical protein
MPRRLGANSFNTMNARLMRQANRGRSAKLEALVMNAYLTDGTRLFRCVSCEGATALLENCLSLEVVVCSLNELAAAELHRVNPANGEGSAI